MMTTAESTVTSPVFASFSTQSSRSRSSTRVTDDVTSLTSFNPFSEEDENDQSSYTLVTSLFSRMKNTLSAPLSSAVAAATSPNPNTSPTPVPPPGLSEQRRPSYTGHSSSLSSTKASDRPPFSLSTASAQVAPPLVSLTPAQSELPTYSVDYERSPSRGAFYSPIFESGEGVPFGYSIPGFPIQDDARSIKTSASLHRSGSVSKIMRRLRGEGLFSC
jgi:1-phosphatidylinositol-3-phosphate 5-kinase